MTSAITRVVNTVLKLAVLTITFVSLAIIFLIGAILADPVITDHPNLKATGVTDIVPLATLRLNQPPTLLDTSVKK